MVMLALLLSCAVPEAEVGRPGDDECLDLCQSTPGLEATVEGDLEWLEGTSWCVCTDAAGVQTWVAVTLW